MTARPDTDLIDLEETSGHLTIWLNSKTNRNALSEAMISQLTTVLSGVKTRTDIRAVTLRGRHGVFCAGGDLRGFRDLRGAGDAAAIEAMNARIGDLFDALQSLPQVVMTFAQGAAIAGGLGLLCCGDIVVVTVDAKFSLTETMIGIVPAQIAPIIVARTGLAKARRLMLTGSRFTGRETREYDLSDYVIETTAEFDALEAELLAGIMKCAPGANGLTKEILLATPHMTRAKQKDFAAKIFTKALLSDEGGEGIDSFLEKRRPSWSRT